MLFFFNLSNSKQILCGIDYRQYQRSVQLHVHVVRKGMCSTHDIVSILPSFHFLKICVSGRAETQIFKSENLANPLITVVYPFCILIYEKKEMFRVILFKSSHGSCVNMKRIRVIRINRGFRNREPRFMSLD